MTSIHRVTNGAGDTIGWAVLSDNKMNTLFECASVIEACAWETKFHARRVIDLQNEHAAMAEYERNTRLELNRPLAEWERLHFHSMQCQAARVAELAREMHDLVLTAQHGASL